MQEKEMTLVVSEDDDDDFFMIEKAMETRGINGFRVKRIYDGEALMDFLNKQHDAVDSMVILLDLNMPKKDGRQALREIKTDPALKKIPILVLTTSEAKEDILQSYQLGANAYFIKPSSFKEFEDMIATISHHWFKFARLPV